MLTEGKVRIILTLTLLSSLFSPTQITPTASAQQAKASYFKGDVSEEDFDLSMERRKESPEKMVVRGNLQACERSWSGCWDKGNMFRIDIQLSKKPARGNDTTNRIDRWKVDKITFRETSIDRGGDGRIEFFSSNQGIRVFGNANNLIDERNYTSVANLASYEFVVRGAQTELVNGDPRIQLFNGNTEITWGDGANTEAPFISLGAAVNKFGSRLPGSAYFLADGLFPSDLQGYKELFTDCVANGDNKNILNDVKIIDNGDSRPTMKIDKQILRNCRYAGVPDIVLELGAYEKWLSGNRSGLVEIASAFSPGLGIYNKVADYFTDSGNTVRFFFVSETHPLMAVVDKDGDLEFFAYDKDTQDYSSIAGHLSPIFKADIHARTTFFSVIANKVFMPPGCTTKVPYPKDNGNAYSDSVRIEDANKCLYEEEDGWLAKWGIKNITPGSGACGLEKILEDSIGQIFNNLLKCIVDEIFIPVLTWAAGLVEQSAGISWWHRDGAALVMMEKRSTIDC